MKKSLAQSDSGASPAGHRGELSEDTPSLAAIVSKVNSSDRRLHVGDIRLSVWVVGKSKTESEAAETAEPAILLAEKT